MKALRSWYGFFAAIAHNDEQPTVKACFAFGLLWPCGCHYGLGAEVGRG